MINDSNWYHFVSVIRAWQIPGYSESDSRCFIAFGQRILAGPFDDFKEAKEEAMKRADFIKAEIEEKFEEVVLGSREN